MAKVAMCRPGGSKLLDQRGSRLDQVRAHLRQCVGTLSRDRIAIGGRHNLWHKVGSIPVANPTKKNNKTIREVKLRTCLNSKVVGSISTRCCVLQAIFMKFSHAGDLGEPGYPAGGKVGPPVFRVGTAACTGGQLIKYVNQCSSTPLQAHLEVYSLNLP